jgi:flagellar motor protein MotB
LSSARRKAALAPLLAPPPEEDQTSWLVTFSDLVLQLFAFVLVALVLGQARAGGAPPAANAAGPGRPLRADSASSRPVSATDATLPPADPARSALAPQARFDDESPGAPSRVDEREIASAAVVPVEDPASAPERSRAHDAQPPVVAAASSSTSPAPAPNAPAGAAAEPAVAESEGEPAPRAAGLGDLGSYLDAFVAAAGLGDGVTVEGDAAEVRVALHGGVGFASGSAELGPAAAPLLRELRKLARTLPDVQIQVAGYTDDVPIRGGRFASNLELSLARAARVARELGAGEPETSVATVAMGFGAQDAIASNADASGRARNRRVEVRLLPVGPPRLAESPE